jgi:hypothetical protein
MQTVSSFHTYIVSSELRKLGSAYRSLLHAMRVEHRIRVAAGEDYTVTDRAVVIQNDEAFKVEAYNYAHQRYRAAVASLMATRWPGAEACIVQVPIRVGVELDDGGGEILIIKKIDEAKLAEINAAMQKIETAQFLLSIEDDIDEQNRLCDPPPVDVEDEATQSSEATGHSPKKLADDLRVDEATIRRWAVSANKELASQGLPPFELPGQGNHDFRYTTEQAIQIMCYGSKYANKKNQPACIAWIETHKPT